MYEAEEAERVEEVEMAEEEPDSIGFPTWQIKHIMLSPSFHRIMNREEAELKLEKQDNSTCYLTRYAPAKKRCYLSVKTQLDDKPVAYYHFAINIMKKGSSQYSTASHYHEVDYTNYEPEYELAGTRMKFDRINELLIFYKNFPINFEVGSIGTEVQSEYTVSYCS